jgi:hypothetical protein
MKKKMGLLEDDSHLKFKPFIKKLWSDIRLILFFGIIGFSIIFGLFSVMDLLGV